MFEDTKEVIGVVDIIWTVNAMATRKKNKQ